ncbi:MAG: hypothetical protein HFF06_01275 [Oscillospiraceae bacterium]|nr:hypothetical protein [Oscillospiraceae bacterium]
MRREERKSVGWVRWLYLLMVGMDIVSLWDRARRYNAVTNGGIYSPEALASYQAGEWFIGICSALWIPLGIYIFLTWKWDREERPAQRADAVASSAIALVVAGMPLFIPFARLDTLDRIFWAVILLIAVGGGAYSWWKVWKDKQNEEIGGDLT